MGISRNGYITFENTYSAKLYLVASGDADKKIRAMLREHNSLADGWQISLIVFQLWESLDCVPECLLVITDEWSPGVLAA